MRAFFGPPRGGPAAGGAQISVHLVPVLDGRLAVFDIRDAHVRGRWLPWAVIDYGQNPYEAASILADDWLVEPLRDLSLVDVLSLDAAGGGWELAIVFRAEITKEPPPTAGRQPFLFDAGKYDAIGPFDPVDLERWVTYSIQAPPQDPPAAAPDRNSGRDQPPPMVF